MKKIKKVVILIILMAIVGTITFFIGRQIGLNTDTSSTTTTIEEVTVGNQTIKKTLTSSGEIKSSETEKLELSTSYYYETMCVEEDDTVKKGENILKYTNGKYLTAPYDCVISSYSVPDTKTKATSSHYVEIQNLKDLTISLSINENEISNISLEQEVEISLTANSNKTYTGKITKIDSIGSYQSSGTTFPVEVSLENDGNIKIGMSVSCTINISELKDVIAVPIDGVQINGDRRYVIAVENGEKKEIDITTGVSNDEYVQVLSGLSGGETIQVATTTKQSTIRNSGSKSSKGSSFGGGNMPSGGDMPNFSGGNMPDFGGGSMPNFEGGKPSGGSSQGRNN
ncbi:MAG: HlyD family efflux transporter periplasmic adaptor subunit [Clostridia bacterium]|nr:HlyD family efflux transporter periplasmic adaptor subunit [Clostridia bacterium]